MFKPRYTSILAASLALMLGTGTALANDEPQPQKKAAAEASSEQPVNDTWITTKVKASLLADADVSAAKIDVDTVNGVVYLTGTVSAQAQAEEAKRIASEIDGVVRVDTARLVVSAGA